MTLPRGRSAGRPPSRRSGGSFPSDNSKSDPALSLTGSELNRRRTRLARLSAFSSVSATSAPTPTGSVTPSTYQTPPTSNETTPAPTVADVTGDHSRKLKSNLIVEIPRVTISPEFPSGLAAHPERMLRRSIYSLKPVPKRKRDEISDSDEECWDSSRDNSPVEKQAGEMPTPSTGLRRSLRLSTPKPELEDSGISRSSTRSVNNVARPMFVFDSVSDLSDTSSIVENFGHQASRPRVLNNAKSVPLQKKAKVLKESGPTSAIDGQESDREIANSDKEIGSSEAESSEAESWEIEDSDLENSDSDSSSDIPIMSVQKSPKNKGRTSTLKRQVNNRAVPSDVREEIEDSDSDSALPKPAVISISSDDEQPDDVGPPLFNPETIQYIRRGNRRVRRGVTLVKNGLSKLEQNHPKIVTMWQDLENIPKVSAGQATQPKAIFRQLKPFQLEGLAWMVAMEKAEFKGGLLGDEMGLGKTIQAVSLIMSDFPAKKPSLVLVPPVALMQWTSEIASYTDGTLKTFIFHGTNIKSKGITAKELKTYDVVIMSYNSLESIYRKQEKGFARKNGIHMEPSVIHKIKFHRVILDEAHCIKTRTTMTAKACFALQATYRWCLTGTPLQNRIGEYFSLVRFLNVKPFSSYLCKECPCETTEWLMDDEARCKGCGHTGLQHVSLFNHELLNPIQKFGKFGPGAKAFRKLRLMTDRIMLRRLKKDHTDSMELPVKEIYVDRQFFGEEETDFANSIMTSGQRKFDTYVAHGVLLNNYANIFGLIMQMRQVADHPDLILKKNAEGGQNVMVCCICDEVAEDAIRSRCKHDFCRTCASRYVESSVRPDCPSCHIPLSIDLDQPEMEQEETLVKKSSIINRIKMENWTSSSKIELLVHQLHELRSDNSSHKSIIFSQFTTMLQLIEWRLRRAGITTVMLDGSMSPAQRQASIDYFMKSPDVECFLVSLRAGGVALNLTEASRVFIVDPWWNPAAEWQSADRCHRIGQTRPCIITRLCIEDSVESRMVLLQEKKTSMINSTVNGDDKAIDSLTPEDLQFLFRGN